MSDFNKSRNFSQRERWEEWGLAFVVGRGRKLFTHNRDKVSKKQG